LSKHNNNNNNNNNPICKAPECQKTSVALNFTQYDMLPHNIKITDNCDVISLYVLQTSAILLEISSNKYRYLYFI